MPGEVLRLGFTLHDDDGGGFGPCSSMSIAFTLLTHYIPSFPPKPWIYTATNKEPTPEGAEEEEGPDIDGGSVAPTASCPRPSCPASSAARCP